MNVKRRVSAQTSTFLYLEALDLVPHIVLFARDTIRTNFLISSKAHLAKQFQFALKKVHFVYLLVSIVSYTFEQC